MKNGASLFSHLTIFICLLVSLFISKNANALHVFGGEIEANCTGNDNYSFKLTLYVDCSRVTGMPSSDKFEVYNAANTFIKTVYLSISQRDTLPVIPNACATKAAGTCVGRVVYTGTGNLPQIVGGYTLAYTSCCRNSNITNVINPGAVSQIYTLKLPGSELVSTCNSAAVFNSLPPSEICTNLPMSVDFSASDADGDQLRYRLVNPLGQENGASSVPPNPLINFSAPYTYLDPLNSGIQIDSLTGIINGTPTNIGLFVIGVAVDEYRNGKKIGTKVRDFTYTIVACAPTLTSNNPTVSTCANAPVQFGYTFAGTLKAGTTPMWVFGDPASGANNTSTLKTPTHQYPSLGTYFATVSLQDDCGNILKDTIKVDIVETKSNVTSAGPYCKGNNVTLSSIDVGCNQMTWYSDSSSSTVLKTGCTYDFILAADSQCVYFEPYVDPTIRTVGASGFQSWGTDPTNSATFDAHLPITIDEFSLNGDQYWAGCYKFNATITVEKNGVVVSGPVKKIVNCNGATASTLNGLNLKVPAGNGYTLKITGATLKPTTGNAINSQVGLITVKTSGPFYNWKVQSDQKCAKRDKFCVKSNCPCPDTTLKFPSPICANIDFDLNTLKTATTSPGTWSIVSAPSGSKPATMVGSTFNASKNGDAGNYLLMYTATGAPFANCVDSNTRVLTILQKDTAEISGDTGPFCQLNTPSQLQISTNASNGAWSGKGINSSGLFSPIAADTGTTVITYTTVGTCPSIDTVHIVVHPKKVADIITADTTVCKNAASFNLRLSNNSSLGGTWLENLSVTTSNFNPKNATATTHKIYYAAQGFNLACSAADSVLVTVNPNADASITAPLKVDFCLQDTGITLVPTILPALGTWWSVPAGAVNTNGKYTPANATVGSTKIYYAIAATCGDTSVTNLTLHNTKNPSITAFGPLCQSASPITMQSANAGTWSIDGVASNGIFNPADLSEGWHEVVLSITDFCPVSDTLPVEVKKIPQTNLLVDTLTGCIPLIINFTDLSDSVATQSTWRILKDGNSISTLQSSGVAQYNFTTPGCYEIELTNQYPYGCFNTKKFSSPICLEGRPVPDFEFLDLPKNIEDPSVNMMNYSSFANSYLWRMPEGNPNSSTATNAFTKYNTDVQDTFAITLIASNEWCADSLTKNVIINDLFRVYVPNAFTPNGDGKNDSFYPLGRNVTGDDYQFMVFNRWGELIYESQTPFEAWNGKRHNTLEMSPNDVYVWKLQAKDTFTQKKQEYIGTVTLLR